MSGSKDVLLAAVLSVALAGTLVVVGTTVGGDDGDDLVRARFASAAPLVTGNEVKVDGVVVGTVESLAVKDGVAEVSMELDDRALPLHQDAQLTIRPVSLLGERYVDLDRGSPDAPLLGEGEVIPLASTATSVGLDEVLNTVDDPTGEGLKALVTTLGEGMQDNGANVDEALRALSPSLAETQQLAAVLSEHNELLSHLVEDFEPVAGALATRDGQAMDQLIDASERVLTVVRERQVDLDQTLERLPTTLRTLRTTLGHLRATAAEAAPTLAELRPLTDRLPEIAAELQRFSDALDPALADSQPVLDRAAELLRAAAPVATAARQAAPGLARTTDGLRKVSAELTQNREHLFNWVRYWALTTNGRDGLSHYFRVNASLNQATLTGLLPTPEDPVKPSTVRPQPGNQGLVPGLLNGVTGLLNGEGIGGLLGGVNGLLGQGGLLDLRRDRARDTGNATGLSEQQERDLLGLLLGGR
jgi:phospholipid/cholesterol/gamma-HCH transport system substrate-binding protein